MGFIFLRGFVTVKYMFVRTICRGVDTDSICFRSRVLFHLKNSMNQGGALVHLYTDGTVLVSHGGTLKLSHPA